jgi:hypothetical protein
VKLAGPRVMARLRAALAKEGYSEESIDRRTNWGQLSAAQANEQEQELRERWRTRWLAERLAAGETPAETAELDRAWAAACAAVPDKSMAA